MSRGKKVVPDYIPAGTHENQTGDPTDKYMSAVDVGLDYTASTDSTALPVADPNEQ